MSGFVPDNVTWLEMSMRLPLVACARLGIAFIVVLPLIYVILVLVYRLFMSSAATGE